MPPLRGWRVALSNGFYKDPAPNGAGQQSSWFPVGLKDSSSRSSRQLALQAPPSFQLRPQLPHAIGLGGVLGEALQFVRVFGNVVEFQGRAVMIALYFGGG